MPIPSERGTRGSLRSALPPTLFLALLVALLVAPAAVRAQATWSLAPFGGIDRSLPEDPTILGLATGLDFGAIGLRLSGSAALRDYQLGEVASVYGPEKMFAYAGDADLVLKARRKAGAAGLFGPVEPRVFAGVGVRAERFADAPEFERHTVVSFGSMISHSLFSRFRGEIEVRRVVPMDRVEELLDDQSIGAWEYRAGLSINFGKGNLRPARGLADIVPVPGAGGGAAGGAAGARRTVVDVAPGTLLHTADGYVGTPYRWGGSVPSTGFDCSGFVQYVYREHGLELPRTSREMWLVGEPLRGGVGALRPGDLMFFAEDGNGRITHVGMYAGSNMLLHSSKSGRGVGYDDLSTPRGRWFRDIYVGARRVLGVPIEGVRLAETGAAGFAGLPGGVPAESVAARAGGIAGSGLAAFMAAAGLSDLSDLAKQLYAPDERPDGPDGAPKRRW